MTDLAHDRWHWILAFILGAGLAVFFHWPAGERRAAPRGVVLEQVLGLVGARYVDDVDVDDVFHDGLDGMLRQLDPYSRFIAPQKVKEFDADIAGSFDGIGVVIQAPVGDGGARIDSVLPGSPVAAAGVLAGDEIVSVDGVDVRGKSLAAVREQMAVPRLTLGLTRADSEPFTVVVERRSLVQPSVEAIRLYWDETEAGSEPTTGVGYLRVSQFQPKTAEEVERAMRKLRDTGANRYVLDLRNNRGGVLDEACELCDLFLTDGLLLSTRGRANVDSPILYRAKANTTFPEAPLVILIDKGSASAAEIVAAALQDHRRAVLVGDESFGKWSVQDVIPLPGGSGKVKLTTKSFHAPFSRWVRRDQEGRRLGIVPHVEIPIDRDTRVTLSEMFRREELHHLGDPLRIDTPTRPTFASTEETDPDGASNSGSGTDTAPSVDSSGSPAPAVDAALIRALAVLDQLADYEARLQQDPEPRQILPPEKNGNER